ncbi:unnamed protein product [Caenorhabditis angaria]|uniref:Uncharacterized protein n=1 Tax=Caenorhabditis angaria TaxID=860376 RepID=A0A9P1N6B0_9PELO|nr:unnamed protein product [Caenorhabditis angaria]
MDTPVKQVEEDTTSSTQDLSESTAENEKKSSDEEIKKALTKTTRKVKYILQPRLRKVTTVSSSLGLVVQTTAEFLTIWILNTSKFMDIGHSDVTSKFELGSWIKIGLFPTGELASLYPQPFIVSPHPTRIVEGKVEVFSTVGESYSIREKGCQFGKVGFRASLSHLLTKKSKETIGVWIRWLTEKEAKETTDKCQWEIVELDQNQTSDLEDFGDHEYRKFSEFIRNRIERPRNYESRLSECPLKSTIRHFGLVTDTYENKSHFSVWSPGVSSEHDHLAKVPLDKESGLLFSEYPPAPGQWLQYDLSPKDAEKYAMPKGGGNRFFIIEYMPINSPKGITVFQIGRYYRIILTCVLVKSTEDPLVYELPDFGYVLDRKSNLRSGAFMQLVLERLPHRTRKMYNLNWKIVGSKFIEVAKIDEIEATQSLITQLVPHYEAYECCTQMSNDRITYYPVYRSPLGSNNSQHRFPRNNFDGPAFMYENSKKKFNNSTVECTALVEKIDQIAKTAILWSFDAAANYHIVYNDSLDLDKGDMIYVTLQQKADQKSVRGFRWSIQKYEKREPTYKCSILGNRVAIYEEMTFFRNI